MVSIDSIPDEPHRRHFDERLASFARLITFDRAGIGLSDPPPAGSPLSIDGWAEDALAVLDAVGSERAAVFGACGGGIPLIALGARRRRGSPTWSLFNAYAHIDARRTRALDPGVRRAGSTPRPAASPDAEVIDDVALLLPSLADDPGFRRWWTAGRAAGREPEDGGGPEPGPHRHRPAHVLPDDRRARPSSCAGREPRSGRTRASRRARRRRSPDARFVELPGRDYFPFAGDADAVADEIEEFLTGTRAPVRCNGCSPRSSSRTSSAPPRRPPGSATRSGGRASTSTMLRCVGSSSASEAVR